MKMVLGLPHVPNNKVGGPRNKRCFENSVAFSLYSCKVSGKLNEVKKKCKKTPIYTKFPKILDLRYF